MADETSRRDANYIPVITGVTDNAAKEIVQIKVDSTTGRLLTDTDSIELGHTAVTSGSIYISGGGNIQQLPSVSCNRAWIQADQGNTGVLMIGGNNVASTASLRNGMRLYPTNGQWFKISNLNLLYFTSSIKGDAINYLTEE